MKMKQIAYAISLMGIAGMAQVHAAADQPEKSEKIEVTGSRIKAVKVESASPITVISKEDIKADGVRNAESLLNNLPQVFADQNGTVSNGSTGTASVNLRGLGADRSLVLVNGRRLPMGGPAAGASAPDLNQIPAPLIKRVEVLTGGAGAIYGSDAVAGVVNFILDDKFEGVQVEVNHSFFNHRQDDEGGLGKVVAARSAGNAKEFQVPGNKSADGKSTDVNILIGGNFGGGKGNATLFFNYKKEDGLLQSERDYSACAIASNGTAWLCGGSGTAATGRITNLTDGKVYTAAAGGTARAYAASDAYNYGPTNYFQRPDERWAAHSSIRYEINEMARIYNEFSFHSDTSTAQVAPGGIFGEVATVRFDNPLLSASWKSALGLNAPGDETDIVVQRRNVEGGGRQSSFTNSSFRNALGVKGDIGNWGYDAYYQAARVNYTQSEQNYFSSQRISRALDVVNVGGKAVCASVVDGSDPNCVPYNVYNLGGITADQLAYLQVPGVRKGFTEQRVASATVNGDLGEYGIKSPAASEGFKVAFGAEHRIEKLNLQTDAATQIGDLAGSGGPSPSVSGQYSVRDLFVELQAPLAENLPFADSLNANLSYRNSDYSTGKAADTYGLGLEWSPISQLKLRGSIQHAVRAPNVIDLFLPQGNNLFDANEDPCAGATPSRSAAECARTGVTAAQYGKIQDSPAGQYNYLQGGNPNLSPEKADTKTLGFVLTPFRGLTATVDYFDIKVKDTISTIDPTTTLDKCLSTGDAKYCGNVTRDALGTLWLLDNGRIIATNQNIGSTRTSGLDFGLSYTQKLTGYGSLGFAFNGTLLDKLETEEIPGEGSYDCVGLYGANKCGAPNPEWRHKARVTWTTPWSLDLAFTWRHFGAVDVQESSNQAKLKGAFNANEKTLDAREYFDIAATYKLTKNFTLAGGINNLLDKDPPITSQQGPSVFGNGNTFPGTYDALGRRVYFNASMKF